MADEAFALSPINARAAAPSDADYDAIFDAFMETGRGRWFLGEYAKRNRNADTRMVLDAVERIETTLASQKQPDTLQADPQTDCMPEVIAAFAQARRELEQSLMPTGDPSACARIEQAIEIVRSLSWRLREYGTDARICDIFDKQAAIIDDGQKRLRADFATSASDNSANALAVFDALAHRIEALLGGADTVDSQGEHLDTVIDAIAGAMLEDEPVVDGFASDEPLKDAEAATAAYAGFREIHGDEADIEIVETAPVPHPALSASADAEEPLEHSRSEPVADHPSDIGVPPAALAGEDKISSAEAYQPATSADRAPPPATAPQPRSLGHMLIQTGIVSNPEVRRADPFAPIRRMSQAERVAFFT